MGGGGGGEREILQVFNRKLGCKVHQFGRDAVNICPVSVAPAIARPIHSMRHIVLTWQYAFIQLWCFGGTLTLHGLDKCDMSSVFEAGLMKGCDGGVVVGGN